MAERYENPTTDALDEYRIFSLALKSEIIVQGAMSISAPDLVSLGISRGHAYDIIAERQQPSNALAFKIYDATGAQFGILKGLSKDTVEELRKQAA